MTLIEGIGDEVTNFFIALFVVIIVTLAWWTTNISEQRHVRTVLLLERRRHRAHRRLTNHTETVTITEGTILSSASEESPNTEDITSIEPSSSVHKPSEAKGRNEEIDTSAQSAHLPHSSSNVEDTIENILDSTEHAVMEHNYAERNESTSNVQSNGTDEKSEVDKSEHISENKSGITIKLKYINDDLKLVSGRLEERLGDFKRRHFEPELSSNKLVRLIFNGQVLQPDTQTLKSCGFFDNCVVHCLIHQKRTQPNEVTPSEATRDGFSFPTSNGIPNLNNNNQNRDWDLGNFLFAFISFILLAAWYFRYVYAHLYTVTATVGLILITGIFTIVLVGMYFPDNEHLPNPTIRIARERVQPQQ
ncbi:hypothetical protein NQ314_012540 [Rhamnusium bicolor]|uniref:Ubiquitin-like domain-containing protein n=1 Tax=Rhamnusium bicolor TaxID=1586634 RepID=A0AAV8XAN6_9CUCU|nr:hypothetical protein NQ314_012540 [Rhamnusium bicolor]